MTGGIMLSFSAYSGISAVRVGVKRCSAIMRG
jgi:hypothetical protein